MLRKIGIKTLVIYFMTITVMVGVIGFLLFQKTPNNTKQESSYTRPSHTYLKVYPTPHVSFFTRLQTFIHKRPTVKPNPSPTPTIMPSNTPTPKANPTPTLHPTVIQLPTDTPIPTIKITIAPSNSPVIFAKPGDTNNDNIIDISDLSFLLSHYLKSDAPNADFNHDGKIDISDLSILLANFGK